MSRTETPPATDHRNRFGAFGGVFTPSILTILGVIMFMRAGFVVGEAGVLCAVLILLIAKSITLSTSLSIGAISTNMQVRGGGAYFMISRVLGPEFGGAIGIALFLAQALSVPFYILGFTESAVRTFPALSPHFQTIALSVTAVLFFIGYVGAGWAIRTQYVILGILGLSIATFLAGSARLFSVQTFLANWLPDYTPVQGAGSGQGVYSFWILFAIYFPAATGIMAGVNMSGDLKDPMRSIPRGTLAAVGVGFLVYLAQILLSGGAFARGNLVARPYETLHDSALFGSGFLVTAGVFAATLSSALGSILGAPRVLQAVARDRILSFLHPFEKGTRGKDEPRRAILLTAAITAAVLLWAGNRAEGNALNAVAAVITMFFLYTYGMTNLSAFIEAFGGNPSFRPQFRWFHWSTALLGALGCMGTAFLIDPMAASAAVLMVALLLWYLRKRELQAAFGDARRGFVFASVRKNLLRLSQMKEDSRNWRPTILVFSGNPSSRETLIRYADWMESGRGIVYLANILVGSSAEYPSQRRTAVRQLEEFCRERNIQAFPVVVVADRLEQGMSLLLQAVIGPIRPNMAMFGWPSDASAVPDFARELRIAAGMGMSLVLVQGEGLPRPDSAQRIDIWWRGRKNGGLMVILAHLLTMNWQWNRAGIRVLRVIEDAAGRTPAEEALQKLIDGSRVKARVEAVVSDRPFVETLHEHSNDAACIFLGFEVPDEEQESAWHRTYHAMLRGMPTTLAVTSAGGEDLLA
jgi:amino acid transporter